MHNTPDSPGDGSPPPVTETAYVYSPTLLLGWTVPRDHLNLSYRGEYRTFDGDEKHDALWIHNLAADLSWRRWSPVFLEVSEAWGRVPRSQERDGVAVVDQIDSSRLTVRTGIVRELGARGAMELAYGMEQVTFPGTEDADRAQRQYGEGLARYRWTPLLGSEFRLSYGWLDRSLAAESTEARASAAVEQRFSEHLAARYSLEWIRSEADRLVDQVAEPEESGLTIRTSLLKGVGITGELSPVSSWNLNYADTQEYLADGDTLQSSRASVGVAWRAWLGSSLRAGGWYAQREYRVSGRKETAWGPTADLRLAITRWLACSVGGGWSSATIREEGLEEREDRRTQASAGIVGSLGRHVMFQTGYQYQHSSSTDAMRSFTSNLYMAQVTYYLGAFVSLHVPSSPAGRVLDVE